MATTTAIPELDGLAGLAAAADQTGAMPAAPGAPGADLVAEAPEPSQADQLAAMLHMIGQAGAMRFPSLAKVYSEEKCKTHGMMIAPALERLGWNLNAGESMIFLTAAGSVLMLLVETRNTIMEDLKLEQNAAAQKSAEPPPPGGITAEVAAAVAPGPATGPELVVHDQMKLYAGKK